MGAALPAQAQQAVNIQLQGGAPIAQPVNAAAAAPSRASVRIDLMARAPLGITELDLGAYYDSSFRALSGAAAISDAQRASLRRTSANERTHAFQVVRDEHELRANASCWGVGSAQLSASAASQHGYFRVQDTSAVLQIPATMSTGQAPVGAAWYVSAIVYGHMVETHVTSSNRDVLASLGARWGVLRGDVSASLSQLGVSSQTQVLGLEATGTESLFVHDASELAQVYRRGAAVPMEKPPTRGAIDTRGRVAPTLLCRPIVVARDDERAQVTSAHACESFSSSDSSPIRNRRTSEQRCWSR
jgi:hypothetical protein